jgi:hypothetical protein
VTCLPPGGLFCFELDVGDMTGDKVLATSPYEFPRNQSEPGKKIALDLETVSVPILRSK